LLEDTSGRGKSMRVQTNAEWMFFTTLKITASSVEGDPLSVGTGFLVTQKEEDGSTSTYLVTNKHVVEGSDSGTVIASGSQLVHGTLRRIPNLKKRTEFLLYGQAWSWSGHPSKDIDITVMPFGGCVEHLQAGPVSLFYTAIPIHDFVDSEILEGLDAIEDVVFVGYPNGIYDKTNNLPIVRRGMTATPVEVDYEGKPIFLIDASVFPGSSGSPVFLYNSGTWSDRGRASHIGNRLYFLGILSSAFYRETDGTISFESIPSAIRPVLKTEEMIDLGVVFKASAVMETIDHCRQEYDSIQMTNNSPESS